MTTAPTVLLVDRHHAGANMLARLLEEDGFIVDVVLDGVEAIARLRRDPLPNAVVTNVNLPNGDGFELARLARKRGGTLPLLFVTEHPQMLDDKTDQFEPPPIVLTKPVDYTTLRGRLLGALGGDDDPTS